MARTRDLTAFKIGAIALLITSAALAQAMRHG
jgi:hypothetical protein